MATLSKTNKQKQPKERAEVPHLSLGSPTNAKLLENVQQAGASIQRADSHS